MGAFAPIAQTFLAKTIDRAPSIAQHGKLIVAFHRRTELEFLRLESEYVKARIARLERGAGNPVQGS